MPGGVEVVVLVEGESDRRAVEVLAERLGRDLTGVVLTSMAGITNLPKHLTRVAPDARVFLLYDAAEYGYVARVMARAEHPAELFGCEADLEDELIRALGVDRVVAVIEAEGELASLRLLQKQPAQRDRTVVQHLRRFTSSHSGRKLRYAEALVRALDLDAVPTPLLALLDAAAPPVG